MNMSQMHSWQSQMSGMKRVIKQKYHKDLVFKQAVDHLLSCGLDHKDIRRAADIAATVKDMQWPWLLTDKETK